MRGDLIELFKILQGLCDYGCDFFQVSERTGNLITNNDRMNTNTQVGRDFFSNRVIKYWNRLPFTVQSSSSVNNFKNNLDNFRNMNYGEGISTIVQGQYWELSEEIFSRM